MDVSKVLCQYSSQTELLLLPCQSYQRLNLHVVFATFQHKHLQFGEKNLKAFLFFVALSGDLNCLTVILFFEANVVIGSLPTRIGHCPGPKKNIFV